MSIAVRRRTVLPEGEPINVRIKNAEQVSGQFGPQIKLDLVVTDGQHTGYEFNDWLKLHEDEETGEVYVKEGGKAWEVLAAVLGEAGAEEFEEASELEGSVFTARTSLRGKAKRNNGLEFGSIGPYIPPKTRKKNQRKFEEEIADELGQAELSAEEETLMNEALGS